MQLPLLGASPVQAARPAGGPLAAKAFRPFFLAAGAFAAALVPIWLLALAGVVRPDAYLDATYWHAHEMVFGYAAAVIAGFLLTAAGNWTARETLTGGPLVAAVALWTSARILLVIPGVSHGLTAVVDLAFLPAVAIAVARPIAASRNRRNYVMVAMLAALWVANLTVHLDVLGILPGWRRRGALIGVDIVVLLVVVLAGRIFPMFTRNATGLESIRSHPRLDIAAIAAMALVTIADAAMPATALTACFAALAACLAVARAIHWVTRHVWRDPLLWILHVSYAWVPVGLALRAIAYFTPVLSASLATHALTVGAIGGVTMGMMARVSLGHTGRKLVAGRPMALAFALVTAAALVRVVSPLLDLRVYRTAVYAAGALWTVAFAIFVVVLAPILTSPRVDGKPG